MRFCSNAKVITWESFSRGNQAGMLRLAQNNKRPSETDDLLDQIQLVAGARNQHYLQLWRPAA